MARCYVSEVKAPNFGFLLHLTKSLKEAVKGVPQGILRLPSFAGHPVERVTGGLKVLVRRHAGAEAAPEPKVGVVHEIIVTPAPNTPGDSLIPASLCPGGEPMFDLGEE